MDYDQYRIALPNGQSSETFDAGSLQSYTAAGHIQPATWIYLEREGRWMAASEVPALQSMWNSRGFSPQYAAPYVQPVNPRGNSLGWWLLGLMIFMGIATFVVLLPIFLRGPRRLSSSVPAGSIVMKSNDGFYAMKVPGYWIPGSDEDPDVPVYYDADASRTISIRLMTASPSSSQQVHSLCAARTSYDYRDKDWIAIGSAVPVTIAGYRGWMQTLHGQYEGNTQVIQLNVISTPNGVYDIAERHYAVDPQGQQVLDNIVKSFHPVEAQSPPTAF